MADSELVDACDRFYDARIASCDGDRRAAHAVRYQVYCCEAAYFAPVAYADCLETDAYDARSLQAVLSYRPSGHQIGAVRVILPPRRSDPIARFPFDSVVGESVVAAIADLPLATSAEVSRLCVSRQVLGEIARTEPELLRDVGPPDSCDNARELARLAKLPLLRSVVEMCVTSGITHVCAVMEPFLLHSLAKLGVHFEHVGGTVRYHGERQPCYAELATLLRIARVERPDVWDVLTDGGRIQP